MDTEHFFGRTSVPLDVCVSCPVLAACRADVIAWEAAGPIAPWGVVGGTTAVQRRAIHHGRDIDNRRVCTLCGLDYLSPRLSPTRLCRSCQRHGHPHSPRKAA